MARNSWTIDEGKMKGWTIELITPHELEVMKETAPGTVLYSISGERAVVGTDEIDNDTRFGYLAYGKLAAGQEPVPNES